MKTRETYKRKMERGGEHIIRTYIQGGELSRIKMSCRIERSSFDGVLNGTRTIADVKDDDNQQQNERKNTKKGNG